MDFGELQRAVFAAHGRGDYSSALELIDEHEGSLAEEHRGRLIFWRACLVSVDGRAEEALELLNVALDEGIWWIPDILEGDPDLEPVRELPGWETYRQRLLAHRDAVAGEASPVLVIEHPDQPVADPCPAVVVLHHAWGSAARTRQDWLAVVDAGWVLALTQSSQPAGTDAFWWTDYERSVEELQDHFATLESQGVDVQASVVGGFSQGAGVGLSAVLTGAVPSRRFAVQAPTFGSVPTTVNEMAESSAAGSVEGVIAVGREDHVYERVVEIAEELEGRIARCELEVIDGVSHEPPPDFSDRLHSWLSAWAADHE